MLCAITGSACALPPFLTDQSLQTDIDDAFPDRWPNAATDGEGNWMVVWSTVTATNQIHYAVSSDDGVSWTAPRTVTNYADANGIEERPQVVTDGRGTWLAVWSSEHTLGDTVGTDRDIFYSVSTDFGETWSPQTFLNTDAETDSDGDDYVSAAADADGNFLVAWYNDGGVARAASTLSSPDSWSAPTSLAVDALSARPHTEISLNGTWLVAWTVLGPVAENGDVFSARSIDSGETWNVHTVLDGLSGSSGAVALDTDGHGRWIAAWATTESMVDGTNIGSDLDIVAAVSIDDGISWSPFVPHSDATSDTDDDREPSLRTDRVGNWVLAWETNKKGDFDPVFSISTDDGSTWGAEATIGTVPPNDSFDDLRPHLATNRKGTWLAFWEGDHSLEIDVDEDLRVARVSAPAIRVDVDTPVAVGSQDGLTWATAFATVQQGVDAAAALSEPAEVWVAEGTYVDTSDPVVTMAENVHLYGGFDGTETARIQRDWKEHETIIDGENARRGVLGADDSTIDGFTVQNCGNLTGSGIGAGLRNDSVSPLVANCTFLDNNGTSGGAIWNSNSAATIRNSFFSGNSVSAAGNGGAISNNSFSTTRIENCVFTGNHADGGAAVGGAISSFTSTISVSNCTFYANTADDGLGPAVSTGENSFISITNCIVWGNGLDPIAYAPSTVTVNHSLIEGGFAGTGNIDVDPLWIDPANGDFRLQPVSPAIDAGTSDEAPLTDIDGTARPQGPGVDMGAYEFVASQDVDEDGLPDADEPGHGTDEEIDDANLRAHITFPSRGASFLSTQVPIMFTGTISSPFINTVVLSTDGGETFDKVATVDLANLTWSCDWSPSVTSTGPIEPFVVVARAGNTFGGFTETEPMDVFVDDRPPQAVLSFPTNGLVGRGSFPYLGTADGGALPFLRYVVDFAPGDDPDTATGWQEVTESFTPVTEDFLAPGDTAGLVDGPYINRLRVEDNDGGGTPFLTSTTYVLGIVVNDDLDPPPAPTDLAIAGAELPGVVADGNTVELTGTMEAGGAIADAFVVDLADSSQLKDVTNEITVHLNGSIRGPITLPTGITADQIALQVRVKDPVGNVSSTAFSNSLLVDNDPPAIEIRFPQQTSTHPDAPILVSGIATDVGAGGVESVSFSSDDTTYVPASGTTAWTHEWTPSGTGVFELFVRAEDRLGNEATASVAEITISAVHPIGFISSPLQGATINAGDPVAVVGSASDTVNFLNYRLQWAEGVSPASGYTTFEGPNTTQVTDNALGTWDTTGLGEGVHTLRLFVADTDVNFTFADVQLNIVAELSISGIPDAVLSEDESISNFVRLPDFVTALSGDPETMTYTRVSISDTQARAKVDGNNNIDITPLPDWNGVATVTVEVDDGAGLTNQDTFTVTVLPVNDLPTTPVIDAPEGVLESEDIAISLSTPSTDADGQTVNYTYRWSVSADGVNFGSPVQETGPTTATGDTLPSSATSNGEAWKVEVTPSDEFADGDPVSALIWVNGPSEIDVAVTPQAIVLGEAVSLAGTISDPAEVETNPAQDESVFFDESVRPGSSSVVPGAARTNLSSAFDTTLDPFHPDAVGAWQFVATWLGNTTLAGASSNPADAAAALTVSKAQPTLTLDLSTTVLPSGGSDVTVWVAFAVDGAWSGLLNDLLGDRTVELFLQDPEGGSYTELLAVTAWDAERQAYVAVFEPDDFAPILPSGFNIPGAWQLQARFDGDGTFLPAATEDFGESNDARLTVRAGAGYAILVVGALDDDTGPVAGLGEGQREHTKTMDFVYKVLVDKGFVHDDIWYMREPVGSEVPPPTFAGNPTVVDDDTPSKAELSDRIRNWAQGRMNAEAAPLYLVMMDHGLPDKFYLFSGAFDGTRIVQPANLNNWLNTLEGGLDAEAAEEDIVVVYGACHSGSFIDTVSKADSKRIIVASSQADELSYRGPVDPLDGIRDGELFVTELFRELRGSGTSLLDAFSVASERVADFTVSRTNGGDPNAAIPQNPLLDDNGDGAGTLAEGLSTDTGQDGQRAASVELGFGVGNPGDSVSYFQVRPTTNLGQGDALPELWARSTDTTLLHDAWIEVKTPDYDGGTPAETGTSTGGEDLSDFQQVAELFQFDSDQNLAGSASGDGEYTWADTLMDRTNTTTLSALMSGPGSYQVYYFIKDFDTGEVARFWLTRVLRDDSANTPPPAVALVAPADEAEGLSVAPFLWEPSLDPDGDPVTYTIEFDADDGMQSGFEQAELFKENIGTPYTDSLDLIRDNGDGTISAGQTLDDLTRYFWRVVPTDSFGASPDENAHTVRIYDVDNFANPVLGGFIAGEVTAAGVQVASFTIDVKDGATTIATFGQSSSGVYVSPELDPGTYDVTVTAEGFTSQTVTSVTVGSVNVSGIAEVDFTLSGAATAAAEARDAFATLDGNDDGKLTLNESGLSQEDFDAIDTNNDGYLSLEELVEATLGGAGTMSPVWVDFAYANTETGEEDTPFNSLGEAAAYVADHGEVLIQGNTPAPFNSAHAAPGKAITLTAQNGTVRLGTTTAPATYRPYHPAEPDHE